MTNRFTRAVFSRYKALRHFSVTFGDFNHQAIESYGYRVPLDDLPVATEAIFTDYDDSEPAMIELPRAVQRAIVRRIQERAKRIGSTVESCSDVEKLLFVLTDNMKSRVNAQFISKREQYCRKASPKLDPATITEKSLEEFETIWHDLGGRLRIVPGKELIAALNREPQVRYSVTVTSSPIVGAMRMDEIPQSMLSFLSRLDDFRRAPVPEGV